MSDRRVPVAAHVVLHPVTNLGPVANTRQPEYSRLADCFRNGAQRTERRFELAQERIEIALVRIAELHHKPRGCFAPEDM